MTSRFSSYFLSACLLGLWGCAGSSGGDGDSGLEGLALSSVNPGIVVPGTRIVIGGSSFVEAEWGSSWLHLRGHLDGSAVDALVGAQFVDYQTMQLVAGDELYDQLGRSEGTLEGEVTLEVVSAVDGKTYASAPLTVTLEFHSQLDPSLVDLQDSGLIFVNDRIAVQGTGFLLGGGEGTTYAVVEGCFLVDGETLCEPISRREVALVPDSPFDRTRGSFAFVPAIAGIEPGEFTGTVALRNVMSGGAESSSEPRDVVYTMTRPIVFTVSPTAASLGQYVDVSGGGFVGGEAGAETLLRLVGTYTPTGAPGGAPVDLLLVPEFVEGRRVRYVVNEDDSLGQALDLRRDTGTFVGTVTPITRFGADEVTGDGAAMTLSIAPVKQVVYLEFKPSYTESLRKFGLRAVDSMIRERVVAAMRRDFAGLNVEVRTEVPADFALYAHVDLSGPDPNGLGLFGYDNTPGKDTGNLRLYDHIGGVNATTQQDGYPGYGGVFIESLLGFSTDPGGVTDPIEGGHQTFDAIFDPFRPDRGGERVRAADLAGGVPLLESGAGCPAGDRGGQIACAVFVLGSLIANTVSHELGHSLGLANPYSEGFHNEGDRPNRLMDAGADRPFLERAELDGQGPAVFCAEAYEYLRDILPAAEPDETVRPSCL